MEWKPIRTMPVGVMGLVWREGVSPTAAIRFAFEGGNGKYLEFPGACPQVIEATHWAPITQPPWRKGTVTRGGRPSGWAVWQIASIFGI